MPTFQIPVNRFESFEKAIKKLQKKAAKLNCPEITLTVGSEVVKHWTVSTEGYSLKTKEEITEKDRILKNEGVVIFKEVEVSGEAPSFNGWSFVATVAPVFDHQGKFVANLINSAPEKEAPEKYRNSVGVCDHCQQKRHRKETFIVENESGETKILGRSCLKDFLGHSNPEAVADLFSYLLSGELNSYSEVSFGKEEKTFMFSHVLESTASLVAKNGFVSKAAVQASIANEEESCLRSTSEDLVYMFRGPVTKSAEAVAAWKAFCKEYAPTEKHIAKAAAATEWIINQAETNNNYMMNLKVIALSNLVTFKQFGLVASLISAYNKSIEIAEKKEQEQVKKALSAHVSSPKKRSDMIVKVNRIISSEGFYGVTGIHLMEDQDGNKITWFASDSATWLEEESVYKIKATVKEHTEYKGEKITVVNRVKNLMECIS